MAKTILDFEKPIYELEEKLEEMKNLSDNLNIDSEIKKIEDKVKQLKESVYKGLTRWQRVQLARHPDRPYTLDYIYAMTNNFVELHGDRVFKDDKAIVGGFASLGDHKAMIIGHQKGRDTKSNLYRNFGMPNPEGYRKALRLMKLAEKFERPVVIGEGASGGALGIGVGDRILMLENCWYSVISPESCSSILWRSWDYKEQAAEALKLTAPDLLEQKLIDRIIPEPMGGAHKDLDKVAADLKEILSEELTNLKKIKPDKLVEQRLEKFGKMGAYIE